MKVSFFPRSCSHRRNISYIQSWNLSSSVLDRDWQIKLSHTQEMEKQKNGTERVGVCQNLRSSAADLSQIKHGLFFSVLAFQMQARISHILLWLSIQGCLKHLYASIKYSVLQRCIASRLCPYRLREAFPMVLVANKVDLVHLRKVTTDQGQEMAAKHNVSSLSLSMCPWWLITAYKQHQGFWIMQSFKFQCFHVSP